MSITVEIHPNLNSVSSEQWNALNPSENPFVRYEFLHTLETANCLGEHNGWFGRFFLIYDLPKIPTDATEPSDITQDKILIAAAPCYIKLNSHGEFVFDWSWADAYHRHGLDYYPKLICAAPYSPVQGPRFMLHPERATEHTALKQALKDAILQFVDRESLSSAHCLFSDTRIDALDQDDDWCQRIDYQFHWQNHQYTNFDAFLSQFKSRKRKKTLHERKVVRDAGFSFQIQHGHEMSEEDLNTAHTLYQTTFIEKHNTPVLTQDFFKTIADTMGEDLVVVWAILNEHKVACAINFKSPTHLYGRYWGCFEEHHCLHFETCFYQGIEYCIEHGLSTYEPGAQGEHKITRGFLPVQTHSSHWIADARFRDPIRDFTERERVAILDYEASLWEKSPFKEGVHLP